MNGAAPGRRKRFDLRQDLWRVIALFLLLLLINVGFYLFLNLPRLRALACGRAHRLPAPLLLITCRRIFGVSRWQRRR